MNVGLNSEFDKEIWEMDSTNLFDDVKFETRTQLSVLIMPFGLNACLYVNVISDVPCKL